MSCGLSKEQTDQYEQLFYSFDTDKDGGLFAQSIVQSIVILMPIVTS